MSFSFPAGAWALLGLGVVLAIHLLHRRSRRVVISTLFLVESVSLRSVGGRRLDRLRRSLSLLLQLAAVALLAWLLMGPRSLLEESLQRVVIVLDSSVSMHAFRVRMQEHLSRHLERRASAAARTEWVLTESGLRRGTLYVGSDRAALLSAVRAWQPGLGAHDARPALGIARSLAGEGGTVLFVTDHLAGRDQAELPSSDPTSSPTSFAGAEVLAVGTPIPNVGFTGVTVETRPAGPVFRALVKNYAEVSLTRRWHARAGDWQGQPGTLELAPGGIQELAGTFPLGRDFVELVLESDAFELDDRLPIVVPRAKPLSVFISASAGTLPFVGRFLSALGGTLPVHPDAADLALVTSADATPRGPAIVFSAAGPGVRLRTGTLVVASGTLTEGLNWNGLLVPEVSGVKPEPEAEVLVWQGGVPVVWMAKPGARHLVVGFPLEDSSAPRLPAFLLLLHRFAEALRASKPAEEQRNVETMQVLNVGVDAGGAAFERLPDRSRGAGQASSSSGSLRAPLEPGFFLVRLGEDVLLRAAAHFADTREADFSRAATRAPSEAPLRRVQRRLSRDHPFIPFAVILLAGLLVADWRRQARP